MSSKPLKIAVISTIFHPVSHTDVIVSRWLDPFPSDALYGWSKPASQIASMYVAQRTTTTDLTSAVQVRYGIPCYPSITEALTMGTDRLAVDVIFLIAEHGEYPENEFRQKLYPRKEFFDEVVDVFRKKGKVVPIFFDKHLSWNLEWIDEMVATIHEMKIPFFGGSSLPFSLPPSLTNIPDALSFSEVVSVYFNSLEAYLFHSAEVAESVIERRHCTASEPVKVTALEGEGVWQALDRGDFSWELVEAACGSSSPEDLEAIRALRANRGQPVYAFKVIYDDGLKVTHFMQKDTVRKWCIGARIEGRSTLLSGTILSSGIDHYFPHFARLDRQIEDFIQSGNTPIPLTRLRNTSMVTAMAMQALGIKK